MYYLKICCGLLIYYLISIAIYIFGNGYSRDFIHGQFVPDGIALLYPFSSHDLEFLFIQVILSGIFGLVICYCSLQYKKMYHNNVMGFIEGFLLYSMIAIFLFIVIANLTSFFSFDVDIIDGRRVITSNIYLTNYEHIDRIPARRLPISMVYIIVFFCVITINLICILCSLRIKTGETK